MEAELLDIEEPVIVEDYSSISVQILYRPVLQLDSIPDCPPLDRNNEDFIWWQEQINRCLFGWIAPNGKYLNGYHYFYMNFVKIKLLDPSSKKWIYESPYYRDNDDEIFSTIWNNSARRLPNGQLSQSRNHVEAKPRGIAWTMITLLGVGLYTFVFKPENPVGCAYPNDSQVLKESTQFQESWKALHPIFKRFKGVNLEPINNSSDLFSIGEKVKGDKIKRIHNKLLLHVIGTESAGVYKGDRMELMIAVEAGLWKGNSLKNYITENEPSIALGSTRWGMTLIGGTSNLIINKTTAYKEIFDEPSSFKATRHFTPATRVLMDHIDYHTGKSLEDKALETILARREQKRGDPDAYQQEMMENPLTVEEAFIPNLQLAYNAAIINKQISEVKSHYMDSMWRRGRMEYIIDINGKKTDQVEFTETSDGEWIVNREGLPNPMYENLHIAAIDDRYKSRDPNKKVDKEASRNAMVVYRQPTIQPIKSDMPVGLYLGNHADMTVAYEEFYKGMLFWDIKHTMYEYNADTFPNFLRDNKKDNDRLYYIGDNHLPGIKVTPKIKTELTFLGNMFFMEGRHKNITCIPILEALLVWGGSSNTDVGSAFHILLLLLDLTKDNMVTMINENKVSQGSYIKLGQSHYDTEHYAQPGIFYKLGQRSA